ncbi:MAG TPA: hypothetical protein PLQ54_19910 [Armatimonadota bacterium]|nr:hypothetical protein [Armatimonadota bacterium]
MTTRPAEGYTRLQIALHWIIAVLVAGQILFGEAMQKFVDAAEEGVGRLLDPLLTEQIAEEIDQTVGIELHRRARFGPAGRHSSSVRGVRRGPAQKP